MFFIKQTSSTSSIRIQSFDSVRENTQNSSKVEEDNFYTIKNSQVHNLNKIDRNFHEEKLFEKKKR